MCGIFGYVTDKPTADLFDLATALALFTEARGPHATGYALMHRDSGAFTAKAALPAREFVSRSSLWILPAKPPAILVGHTRYATAGSPEKNDNNHPHWSLDGKLALVHNGVLNPAEYEEHRGSCLSECDSEAIIRTVETAATPWQGAALSLRTFSRSSMACAMLDVKGRRALLWRNAGNPLAVWRFRSRNLTVFASTHEIIRQAVELSEFKAEPERTDLAAFRVFGVTINNKEQHGADLQPKFREVTKPCKWWERYVEGGRRYAYNVDNDSLFSD